MNTLKKIKWIPDIIDKVLVSRCYLIEIQGKRVIKRHIDQILQNKKYLNDKVIPEKEIAVESKGNSYEHRDLEPFMIEESSVQNENAILNDDDI